MWWTEFFVILDRFLSFYPLTTWKIQILKNWKKWLEILSFYTCTIDGNHMMYGSWDNKCNGYIFLVILEHFSPFYPRNNLKNQNFEKIKKMPGDIIILHMCTINNKHMIYGSWDMECDGQNFLSFWTIFYPFTPKNSKNQN